MKKICLLFLLLIPVLCAAQQQDVTIYLNNGNIVVGQIVENGQTSLTVRKNNGDLQTFRQIEINKIVDGARNPLKNSAKYVDYVSAEKGFWGAVEIGTGANIHITSDYRSSYMADVTFVGGYRINKFFQFGLGAGVRRYFSGNDRIYVSGKKMDPSIKLAFPVFFNVRGLVMDNLSRTVVPYWSANIGYTIFDGFYFAPSVGIRIGSTERHHIIVGVGYALQHVNAYDLNNVADYRGLALNAATLKIGYQF